MPGNFVIVPEVVGKNIVRHPKMLSLRDNLVEVASEIAKSAGVVVIAVLFSVCFVPQFCRPFAWHDKQSSPFPYLFLVYVAL